MSMKFVSLMNKNKYMNMFLYSLLMLPTPSNINMWWNFGSMLGVFLLIQIVSGLLLSMHYCPNVSYAFESIIHIMKDVNFGWLIRLVHMNGASFYFMMMYVHISRNIYYQSFKLVHVWSIGVTILFLSMATAFLGYVLPWGQMSFWGATVITNLLSAIPYFGEMLVEWIWGGFSINNATLNRFFSLHFILPLVILSLVIMHIFSLHLTGSSNPLGSDSNIYKMSFHPYFTIKDMMMFIMILLFFMVLICQNPYYLGDPDNFKIANSMVTPTHIKPEWYFLFAYSILRAIPNKLGGVLALLMSILILYVMPLYKNFIKSNKFYPVSQLFYWFYINNFIMLTWLGGQVIEYPYVLLNWLFTLSYFLFYVTLPLTYIYWDKIINF
uniref:Cytochrome b n=1 Tax=Habropoda radoszkowskii TaxID=597470 RepID=A0A7L8EYQ7_9HYME|nr:cytochrome b [Habropoda radoszkowskii]QOE17515.1 cytochrome b [Habropoda radoszkowskii]